MLEWQLQPSSCKEVCKHICITRLLVKAVSTVDFAIKQQTEGYLEAISDHGQVELNQ